MKNFRDDELKKWLAEEYEKETSEMEKTLFPDGVIPDDGETEEEARAAYQELVKRLKADGVYKEDETDSDKADDHRENVKIVYLPEKRRHKAARVAAAVIVCAAGIFAASMTSQANRSYFIDSVRYWVGDDTKIVADNDKDNEKADMNENDAIDNIEEELGADIPYFMYRPIGFEFRSYDINEQLGYACMEYDCNDSILLIQVDNSVDNQNSRVYSLDGKQLERIKFVDEGIEITIVEVKDKLDKKENYVAYWEKEDYFYEISGKLDKGEFIKIIKKMRF